MIATIARQFPRLKATLIRIAIFGGLLLAEVVVGVMARRLSPTLLLAAVVALPGILLGLNHLEYGVLSIILAAIFVRASLPTGTQSRIVASLLMTAVFAAMWLAKMLVVDKKLHLRPSRANVPLLGFLLVAVISYVWSNAFRDPLVIVWKTWPFVQLGALAIMILLPAAFLLTANSVTETRWLQFLCWTMILTGVISLADHFFGLGLSFINTGGLFSLWFVSLAYAQALFNQELPLGLRAGLLALVGIWMYIQFVLRTSWLAGWVPSLVAIVVISFLRSRNLFLVLVLLFAVYIGLDWDYYSETVWERELNESGVSRLASWRQNWVVTGKHLLFGTGPAGYAAYYMSYFPTQAMATHNNYIDMLSQVGIIGLFLIIWFLAALVRTGWGLCNRVRAQAGFTRAFACAALGGCMGVIVAMGLGDWVFPFVYTQSIAGFDYAVYSWVLLGGMIALDRNTLPPTVCEERMTR